MGVFYTYWVYNLIRVFYTHWVYNTASIHYTHWVYNLIGVFYTHWVYKPMDITIGYTLLEHIKSIIYKLFTIKSDITIDKYTLK
jgi:hypothetical protein